MSRVNWKHVVEITKNEILPYFEREGVKPTLRTIFYALVSRNIIPNTRNAYNHLSSVFVNARKSGIFPWDFIADKTRYTFDNLRDHYLTDKSLELIEHWAKERLESIDINELLKEMFDSLVPRGTVGYWAKQPVVPEIWIEKDALATTIDNWTYDLQINIRVNRGYSSWTFIYNNVLSLRELLEEHEKVVILYLGDLDPSGIDIQRFLSEAITYFGLDSDVVELKRLAVTEEHVDKYNLPPRPEDRATLEKLYRDPRARKYTIPYVVELDALIAYVPDEFRKIVRNAIESYHDKAIYESVRKQQEEIHQKIKEIVESYKKMAMVKIIEQIKGGE